MHELSLAESIIDILKDGARSHGYTRVKTVRLEIGKLSHVEPEAMRFCFDVVARDSLAEGARLEITETDGEGLCLECGSRVGMTNLFDLCPKCENGQVRVVSGTELRVKELEVE